MTAEIAIMNKEAIALASDSAVTMIREDGEKIFTSANKLFALSKYHPVGIMVYGSAVFMGVPWETIIKIYRKKVGKKNFGTVEEYCSDFIKFLDKNKNLFPTSVQESYLQNIIIFHLNSIRQDIENQIHTKIDARGEIDFDAIEKIVEKSIIQHNKKWKNSSDVENVPNDFGGKITKKHKKFIDSQIKEIFEELPLSAKQIKQLNEIVGFLFSKFPVDRGDFSGVVIAGFGENDIFPSLTQVLVGGKIENRLVCKKMGFPPYKINFQNNASIIPFAQSEMVYRFMEGIDPDYEKLVDAYISSILDEYSGMILNNLKRTSEKEKNSITKEISKFNKQLLKDFRESLELHRKLKYVDPIINVVAMLPKEDLAVMAETFVNLTSFKRKVSMERETVGGPIDVAVISKGDGFIWIKRKHYFKAELNPQFFSNYYREAQK